MTVKTNSAQETKSWGAKLGKKLLKDDRKEESFVFSLEGKLGTGKTTFIKGLASVLGAGRKIKSPSFVLTKKYKLACSKFQFLFHLDCYRLSGKAADLDQIAFKDIVEEKNSIVVIEWGEKIESFLPGDYYKIEFSYLGKKKRKLQLPPFFFN